MSQKHINVGTHPNDTTGTPARTAWGYTEHNFNELYALLATAGLNHWRGTWDGDDALPETGGTYTDDAPGAGDEWRLTQTLIIEGKTYAAGTIIKAMVNSPGQTLTNWAFLAVQL